MEVRTVIRFLALSETRRAGRQHHGRWIGFASGVVFTLLLLQLELFLFLVRSGSSFSLHVYPWDGQPIWWNFPYLQILTPWAILILPFYPGIAAGLTAILAGIGTGAAFVAIHTLVKRSSAMGERPVAVAVILLGFSGFALPLAMQGGAYWAYFNDPEGYTWWAWAWYLYPLEILASFGMLLVLERVLRIAGPGRNPESPVTPHGSSPSE